jgi:hypothetical protein
MENYDGPGPTMLSNLRFNTLMQTDRKGGINYLVVRLVPRSTTNSIKVSKVEDMSFRLSLALINEFQRDEGLVFINLNYDVTYMDPPDPIPTRRFQVYLKKMK